MFWQKKTVIAAGPLAIALLLPAGWRYDLFHTTAWYDVMMHFLGGGFFVISLTGAIWHLRRKKSGGPAPAQMKPVLLLLLLLLSIAWEILEVFLDMTPNWTQSKSDTFSDIIWAQIGAVIALRFVFPKN
jgi:hypothetical protein